jgi:hypothetical protein
MASPAPSTDALSWRVPPAYAAILFLVVSACAAANIYLRPSGQVRGFTIVLGIGAFVWAIACMRMYLFADRDGVGLRFVGRQRWLPWSEIARIDVVSGVRGAHTIRLNRHDSSYVDVPPSLLQPAKPTKKPDALARLKGIVAQLDQQRPRA